jgi:hypothetical protein
VHKVLQIARQAVQRRIGQTLDRPQGVIGRHQRLGAYVTEQIAYLPIQTTHPNRVLYPKTLWNQIETDLGEHFFAAF